MSINPELPQMLCRTHLGCGDFLVCNALFRHFAKQHHVFLPCKRHNVTTVNFMLRDVRNIEVLPIEDDKEADEFCGIVAKNGYKVLKLGLFGQPPFDPNKWDLGIYAQANVPFQDRWSKFVTHRQPSRELKAPEGKFCFIHEDPSRGFKIDRKRLPTDLPWVFAEPGLTQNLFDWWAHVEEAEELHFIDSCFAIMADSLPELKARKVVVHVYARAGARPPTFGKGDWKILYK